MKQMNKKTNDLELEVVFINSRGLLSDFHLDSYNIKQVEAFEEEIQWITRVIELDCLSHLAVLTDPFEEWQDEKKELLKQLRQAGIPDFHYDMDIALELFSFSDLNIKQ
ncbi:hypothetical protein Pla110_33160 [Polystyrenella longa]|uniref:Uncharacterized protein n=1 Tax=Polystyrenella longa TaxID=2528007 RepID=A0A518CQU5_9PLAN|nr:hypothetical protein [Polystyrenella longa]QDU81574.1 hypothetical protein Pla110_33160 [Polystyrenella longa]